MSEVGAARRGPATFGDAVAALAVAFWVLWSCLVVVHVVDQGSIYCESESPDQWKETLFWAHALAWLLSQVQILALAWGAARGLLGDRQPYLVASLGLYFVLNGLSGGLLGGPCP